MNQNADSKITDGFLRHIAENSDNELLREMAGEVLRGNISLADGMAFSAYADAFEEKRDGFTQWYDGLSDDERAREAGNCATEVEKLEEQLAVVDADR